MTSSTGSGRPTVIVVTGPSGAGKGTLIRKLLERVPDVAVTVSATTRDRRPGEEEGREYRFLTSDEFLAKIGSDEFLEQVVDTGIDHGRDMVPAGASNPRTSSVSSWTARSRSSFSTT